MSSLACDKYVSKDKKYKREAGDKAYPIWLLVNPKHTSVRHFIWTPVLAEIQDKVYRKIHTRINSRGIYIRSAVQESATVPRTLNWWGAELSKEIELFREIVVEYKPKIIITFGAFPYEFMRRVYQIKPEKGPKSWGTDILGYEFARSIENFDIDKTNMIPLLRRVVTSDKFIEDFNDFGENYFQYVGSKIADKLIENKDSFKFWID